MTFYRTLSAAGISRPDRWLIVAVLAIAAAALEAELELLALFAVVLAAAFAAAAALEVELFVVTSAMRSPRLEQPTVRPPILLSMLQSYRLLAILPRTSWLTRLVLPMAQQWILRLSSAIFDRWSG